MFGQRKKEPAATLEDVVEVLHGIGLTMMRISARLDDIYAILEGKDDEES